MKWKIWQITYLCGGFRQMRAGLAENPCAPPLLLYLGTKPWRLGEKINPWISACGISHVWLFCHPTDCSLPGFSVPGIFQARILGWVAISYSRGSSWPRDQTLTSWVSYIGRWVLHHCATWEAQNSWIGWVLFAVFRIFFVMLGCCSLNPWEDHLNLGQKNTCWT